MKKAGKEALLEPVQHSTDGIDELGGDGSSRVIGMIIGGGAGAFFLVLLGTYAGVPVDLLLGLPGIGLAGGMGIFSFRRSKPWGILAVALGYAWTVFVLWLRAPKQTDLAELAFELPLTLSGAPHVLLVVILGYLLGAGWKKAPLEQTEDQEA
jgi:hypothetical protein